MKMHKIHAQAVPYSEHPTVTAGNPFNWEDLRVFLSVGRSQSFRSAAHELGLSFNTVRRHVDRLEHASKSLLLARHPHGIELTREGRLLLASALRMEEAAAQVERINQPSVTSVSGRVKISITEGLGTFWLVPKLIPFQRSHPNVILDVNCTFREPNLSRMEADISIQLTQPKHANLKTVRIGHMHVMPFASPEYLTTYGLPKSLHEIEKHKIVEQLSPQLDVTAIDRIFPGKSREGFVSLVTNTSTAHFWAVVRGGGIGMLPTYLGCLGARIVPLDIDLRLRHEIWLSYHSDARRQRRVSIAIDWLRQIFNPTRFAWFGDQFVHPRDFDLSDSASISDNHFSNLLKV